MRVISDLPSKYTTPIGHKPNGDPIYLIAGGSVDSLEGVVPPATPEPAKATGQGEQVFTKADIESAMEKARQQEKDKVYGRLESLQSQIAEFNTREQSREAAEAEARREAEEAARRKAEEEMDAKTLLAQKEQEFQAQIQSTQQSFEQKLQEIETQRQQERAVLEKERELATLTAYTQQRVAAERDNIAPQLLDFVTGNSPEEIEQSIATLKAKSEEIANAARDALTAARAQTRGVSTFGYAPVGPMEVEGANRQYSPEDIANMSIDEYAKFRTQIPGLVNGSNANRGLYS